MDKRYLLPIVIATLSIAMTGCGGNSGDDSKTGNIALDNQCFDDSLSAEGTLVEIKYAVDDDPRVLGVRLPYFLWSSKVESTTASFNGNTDLIKRSEYATTYSPAADGAIDSRSSPATAYYEKSISPGIKSSYGYHFPPDLVAFNSDLIYLPPHIDSRVMLRPGEEANYTVNMKIVDHLRNYSYDEKETIKIKFIGLETLDFSGKKLTTCKYEIEKNGLYSHTESSYFTSDSATEWRYRGQVVRAQWNSDGSADISNQKMISGTINGVSIL